MQIALNAEDRAYLEACVAAGEYESIDDALADAVMLLRLQQRDAEIRRKLDEALEDSRAGRVHEATPALFDEIKREGRTRLTAV